MQDELKAIQRQVGTTFVHVTHDQEEAMAIADRIVVMNAGRIEDHGPPARVYRKPSSLFAADFMGETNHIPAQVTPRGLETPFGCLPLPAPTTPQGPAVLCLRPEAISTGNAEIALGAARVRDAAFFGPHIRAHLVPEVAPDLVLIAHLPPGEMPAVDTLLTLSIRADTISVFPKEP
ncbi:MAG: TOBE domain-containing protein [Roseobacter sp.]|nr:TOBE domain-containing protein [Roseobacter sp.]